MVDIITAMRERTEIRAVRFRVLPGTRAKARCLSRIAGACRYVWNVTLDDQQILHDTARMFGGRAPLPTFFTLGKGFTQMRNSKGHEWLRELPFTVIRYTLKRQADAWQRFFKGQGGHPKFKGRHSGMGFTIPGNVRIRSGRIAVPKMGEFRLRRKGGNPHPDGKPKQAVFTPEGGRWFCTVFYEVAPAARADDGTAVGIDRNVGQCALSDGKIVCLPNLDRLEARRKRYQRRMARQQRGSGRRRRTKAKLTRASRRIANVRANWCHKVSRNIADRSHAVVIEDLNSKGMTASAKGTKGLPGTNVRQKAGLNRSILASGWHGLERNLDYKAGRVVRVHPGRTSQTCHGCGAVDAANRVSQSTFRCQACGHSANADVNAARNILASGIGASGRRGALPSGTPATRQTGGEVRQAA